MRHELQPRIARVLLAAALLCAAGAAPAAARVAGDPAQAHEEGTQEYAAKAAFLYKFTRYAKWPDSAFKDKEAPLRVAVYGRDPFGKALDEALKEKKLGLHPLTPVRFATLADLGDCQLVFVPASEESELERVRQFYKEKPVLVVGDSLGAAEHGAAIGFFLDKARIRFAVNTASVRESSLEISSELLKLAKVIEKEREVTGR